VDRKLNFNIQRVLCHAEAGNAWAQLTMAEHHKDFDTAKHDMAARKWYALAALSREPYVRLEGRYMIATNILNRTKANLPYRDRQKAVAMLKEVADSLHPKAPKAQLAYGMLLTSAPDVPRDMIKGMVYLRKAAGDNPAVAAERLGQIYFYGESGIKPDRIAAKQWYELAANTGCAHSQYMCGLICTTDKTLQFTNAEGMKWLRMAAAQKHEPAISWLRDTVRMFKAGLRQALPSAKQGALPPQYTRH
jgi:TPR repeat protein